MAKRGVDKETRRTLGYHAKSDERSLEAYSRDSMAGPLRTLVRVIGDIKSERFKPDVTRSGQIVEASGDGASSCSSSAACSSSSEDPDPNDVEVDEEALAPYLQQDKYIRNDSSRRIHVLFSESNTLACGSDLPVKFSILSELPDNARFCGGCF